MKTKNLFHSREKSNESGYGRLLAIVLASALVLGLFLYCAKANAQITLTYNQSFTGGVPTTTQCGAWNTYRSTLLAGYTYGGFNISGSMDPVGITCTDPVKAKIIANNLRAGTSVFGVTSDGHNWFVQAGCATSVELGGDVLGGGCSCSSGYSVRPCFTPAANWGGINGPNCGAASQTMIVKFFVVPVSFNNGPSQPLAVCENASTNISSLLTVTDGEGDTETWTVTGAPTHGTITGLPATAPSDTNVSPAGVVYTPAPGYNGPDVFTVQVNNGFQTATTTVNVTVSPAPANITGSSIVCTGNTTSLTETTGGGVWASSNTALATAGPSGVVSGIAAGAVTISYTAAGCTTTFPMTVDLTPSAITGTSTVCVGSTLSLSDASPAGIWSSSSVPTATVGTSSGVVTGVAAGAATITYTLAGGCNATKPITVNPTPAAITGATTVCTGVTTTLGETVAGGSWSSSNVLVAGVDGSGNVTGVNPGPVTITYTLPAGCTATYLMTVNQTPGAITGPTSVCSGSTITLGDVNAGGTWTSSSPANASIGSSSGIVTGSAAGNATITYALAGGCNTTAVLTINTTPAAITGATTVCSGNTVTLAETTAGGTWTSSNVADATVGASTGIVSGMAPGAVVISYSLPTGCNAAHPMTVNQTPSAISGPSLDCPGYTISLSDTYPGGSWTSSNLAVATVGAGTGVVMAVTPGVSNITYTLPGGCNATMPVTVSATLPAISGSSSVCVGNSTTLSDGVGGGTWSSDNAAVISIGATTGVITGNSTGTVTISYSVGACAATKLVTANPAPSPIVGGPFVCVGSAATLSDPAGAGIWTSSNPTIATVGSSSGVVTGGSAGSATITYATGVGCSITTPIIVNPLPAAIGGATHICVGSTATLSDATPGGVWSSSNPAIATITGSGIATGIFHGLDTISYTLPTGCSASESIPVISVPPFTGLVPLCAWTDTVTIHDSLVGGIYTSFNVNVNNEFSGNALVNAHAPGMASITYTMPTGCYVTETFTVNPLPDLIYGDYHVCTGHTSLLADPTTGGVWSSSNPAVAPISPAGLVTGLMGGTTLIAYTLPTGCKVDTLITVGAPPTLISGSTIVCAGASAALSDSSVGGLWISSNTGTATVGSTTGILTGVSAGAATITYSFGGTCIATIPVTVNPLPVVFNTTGGGTFCAGSAGADIELSGSQAGVNYQLYNGLAPVDTALHGTGGVIDFGFQPGAGMYTVIATYPSSSCSVPMTGSATISVNPAPTVFTVTGGGSYCPGGTGVHIGLAASQPGINYQLDFGTVPSGAAVAGTSGALDFGLHTAAGSYVVMATNPATSCSSEMADTVTITISPTVVPSVSVASSGGDTVCPGTAVTITPVAINGGTSPAYQWQVNGVSAGTGSSYSYIPANGDVVRVILTSNATCATPDTASSSLTLTVEAALIPVVAITATPGTVISSGTTVTFTANVTGGGISPAYQWELNGVPVAGATNATYTISTLANGDTVSCFVTASTTCGPLTGKGHAGITVNGTTGVHTLTTGGGIVVLPNPNNGTFTVTGTVGSTNDEEVTLAITDMLGQVVYKNSVMTSNGKLNAPVSLGNNIANGMYLLSVRAANVEDVFHVAVKR